MSRPAAAAAALLRALTRLAWFIVVPALAAGLTIRYLVPPPRAGTAGALDALSQAVAQFPAPFAALLFLYFACVVRYWVRWLPGANDWLPQLRGGPAGGRRTLTFALSVGLAVVGALVVRSTLYTPYRVQSASMLPTLEPGALLIAEQSAYGVQALGATPRAPQRGDVVLLRGPDASAPPLVKRVIGLPGDVVRVNFGHPVINDWVVPGCNAGRYAYLSEHGLASGNLMVEYLGDAAYLTLHSVPLSESMAAYQVPPGQLFVLGDNRNNSSDSRAWNDGHGGSVPFSHLLGRVQRLLLGVQRNGELDFSSLLRRLDAPLQAEGLDTAAVRAAIEKCMKTRPSRTRPPATAAESVSSVSTAGLASERRSQ